MQLITRSSREEGAVRALRSVVITGGAAGLGAAVARAVKAAGGTPIVLDLGENKGGFEQHRVDVSNRAEVEAVIEQIAREHDGITSIVTCAGIDACGRFEDVDPDRWEAVIRVNLIGTASIVRAALPWLRKEHGKIITVASTLGLRVLSDASAYCASKHAVVAFTRALTLEVAGEVGVTLLIPGGMHTSFFDDRDPKYKPPADARLNAPDDVARAVVFALCQPPGCEIREMVVCPSTEQSWP